MAALLTARLPVKTGMLKGRFLPFTTLPSIASSGGLPLSEITLAELLKENGYTSSFVGFWNQGLGSSGKFLPINQGFDSWFGIVAHPTIECFGNFGRTHKMVVNETFSLIFQIIFLSVFIILSVWCLCFLKARLISSMIVLGVVLYLTNIKSSFIVNRACVLYQNNHIAGQPYDVGNLTLRFTNEALGFIKATPSPFLLMINHLHLSSRSTSMFFKNTSEKNDEIIDSLVELDWSVGSILKTIDVLKLKNNTIVVFTALSGGHSIPTNTLEGIAGILNTWETHLCVPLFIKNPILYQQRQTISQSVTLMDIMPTVLDYIGAKTPSHSINGKSLINVTQDQDMALHKYIFHHLQVTRPSSVTHKDFKVYFSFMSEKGLQHQDPPLLFNIKEDPNETSPLPNVEYSELLANITEELEKQTVNQSRKWISQFEHPILPWLFPCNNFPYCHQRDVERLQHVVFNQSLLFK